MRVVIFTIPNILTFARLLMVPVFLYYFAAGEPRTAVWVFAIASITDLFDGLLARLLRQKSRLGGILDPVADKALGLSALLCVTATGKLPWWLLGLTLARDLTVVGIVIVARLKSLPVPAAPSRLGKSATFHLNVAVLLALAGEISYARWLPGATVAFALLAGECLAVVCVQYVTRFTVSMEKVLRERRTRRWEVGSSDVERNGGLPHGPFRPTSTGRST